MSASWIWLILLVAFVLIEAGTHGLVSIWFGAGALVSLVTSFISTSVTVQITVFFVVSFALFFATMPFAKKMRAQKQTPLNADRNLGKTGTVVVEITPQVAGRIKLDGVDWNAVSDETLQKGELCVIKAVNSATVTVSRLPQTVPSGA